MIIRSNWGWEDRYWNLPQAVEQAVNIWYEPELVDINSLIGFSSTAYTRPPAIAAATCKKFVLKPAIRPRTIKLTLSSQEDDDKFLAEAEADAKEAEEVASRKKQAEHRACEIKKEAWLRLKTDLRLGKLRAIALPCQNVHSIRTISGADPADVSPRFWEQEDLSESTLDKPYPFGINARPHLVVISKQEFSSYLNPEEQMNQASPGSSKEQNTAASSPLNPAPKRRGGRKPMYDWNKVEAKAYELLEEHGDITPDKRKWNAQARLVTALLEFYQETSGTEPADSTLKAKVRNWVANWREKKRGQKLKDK